MKFRYLAVLSALALLLGMTGCKKESVNIQELEKSLVGVWWDEYEYEDETEDGIPFSKVLLAVKADADHTGCIYLGVFDDESEDPLVIYGGPDEAGFTWKLLSDGTLELSEPTSAKSVAMTRGDSGNYGSTMTDVSGTSMTYTDGGVTVNNGTYSSTLTKADAGTQTTIQNTLTNFAASANSTLGTYTDSKGRTRECIVVTIKGEKYAIATTNERENATHIVGDVAYYNWYDACKYFAGGKTDGSYNETNVWRLLTGKEANVFGLLRNTGTSIQTIPRKRFWIFGRDRVGFTLDGGYFEEKADTSRVNSWAYYWTSRPDGSYAHALFFSGGKGYEEVITRIYKRSNGYPVRLFCKLPTE